MEIGNIIYYIIVILFIIRSVHNYTKQQKENQARPNAKPKRKSTLEELFESFDMENRRQEDLVPAKPSNQHEVLKHEHLEKEKLHHAIEVYEPLKKKSIYEKIPLEGPKHKPRHLESRVKREIDSDWILDEEHEHFDLKQAVLNEAILNRVG
jgi:hypothetical protein